MAKPKTDTPKPPKPPAEENAIDLVIAKIRAQQAEVRRLADLYAETEDARINAARMINELEEQALEVEKNIAKGKAATLRADEKLKDNEHERMMLNKRAYELERQRRSEAVERQKKHAEENDIVKRMGGTVSKLSGYWMEAVAAVYGMIEAVRMADDAMEKAFLQRNVMANLPFKIGEVRTATLGLVEDSELARLSIEAQRLGVVKSEADFAKLAKAATKLGLSVGKDATSSVESLVGALGRGETELLDNLGVTLKMSDAHKAYAEQLGTTVSALTDEQKAEAFRVIGMQKAIEASENVTISVTESEQAWINARKQYDKLSRETLPQATESMGELWKMLSEGGAFLEEAIPVIARYLSGVATGLRPAIAAVSFLASSLEALFRIVEGAVGLVGRATDAIGGFLTKGKEWASDLAAEVGDYLTKITDWLADSAAGDAAAWLRDTVAEGSKGAREELGKLLDKAEESVPIVAELGYAWSGVKEAILGAAEAGRMGLNPAKSLNELFAKGEELAAKHQASKNASLDRTVKVLGQQIKLAQIAHKPEREIEKMLREQYKARMALLLAQGKQAEAADLMMGEELRRAQVREDQREAYAAQVKATGAARLAVLKDEISLLDAQATLTKRQAVTATELSMKRHELALAELDVERKVLAATKAKSAAERITINGRLASIAREEEVLGLTHQIELGEKRKAQFKNIHALQTELARQEQANIAEVIRLDDYRFARREQQIEVEGEAAQRDARNERQRLEAKSDTDRALHVNRLAQIEAEYQATLRELDARKRAAHAMDTTDPMDRLKQQDDLRKLAHDAEVARIENEIEVRRAADAEEARLAEVKRARTLQTFADVQAGVEAFGQLYDQAASFASFVQQRRAEQDAAALQNTIANLNERGRVEAEHTQREIEAAAGNVALQNELRRKGVKQQQAIQKSIEKAQIAHNEKVKKQEARAAGFKLLIDSVVLAAQAAGSFASFNMLQGGLQLAASVANGIQGAMLLAGQIPGAGSAAGAGSGAGSSGNGSAGFDRETSAAAKTPGSMPGTAATRNTNTGAGAAANQGGGTTIIIQGGIHANGAIDDEFADKLAIKLKKSGQSREAAA